MSAPQRVRGRLTKVFLISGFGLFVALCLFGAAAFPKSHKVHALSNVAPASTEFATGSAYFTLSDTNDVQNSNTMGLGVYHAGAKPTSNVDVTVTYQSGSGQCGNQNFQGNGGANFSYGVGAVFRQTTIAIPPSAWSSLGVGYTSHITASLQNGTNDCGGGSDGNHVNFKLSAPSGNIIGPDSSYKFAIVQGSYCVSGGSSCNGYVDYNIPFAPDCNVTTGGTATAKIYDMDNDGTHPIIQPPPLIYTQIVNTTSGVNTNNNTFTGGEGNGQTAYFSFPYSPQYNYSLKLSNVNKNNVLQIQLPFDSINAQINCAPKGNITSSAATGCSSISGWMYDSDNPATQLKYYVFVNPLSPPPPATYATDPGYDAFVGPFTANKTTPASAPSAVPDGHGFVINIPSDITDSLSQHNYKGPWVANDYWIYAKDATSTKLTRIDNLTVPKCATPVCGTSDFAVSGVNQETAFTVIMNVPGNYGDTPLPDNAFTVKITKPDLSTYTLVQSAVAPVVDLNASWNNSTNQISSGQLHYTPTKPGSYKVSWVYDGITCGTPASVAGYTPYFSVQGGDIAAGGGFTWGASCTGIATSDISSWSTDTATLPHYTGAGTEQSALATGDITDFVSGMKLNGGAATLAGHGLSFANFIGAGYVVAPNYGGQFGNTASLPCLHDYQSDVPVANRTDLGTSTITSSALSSLGTGAYRATATGVPATVTIGDGSDITLGLGHQVVLYVRGNVYINNNIVYNYATLAEIPQFKLIVQGAIYISPTVTDLHGIYIASGYSYLGRGSGGGIITCSTGSGVQTQDYNVCNQTNKPLTFTGAVAAENHVFMDRTHGSVIADPTATPVVPAEPAEVFQYSPEVWLPTTGSPSLQYQSYTSLPPVL